MRMSKRQYRIGEVAKRLNLKKFVLRFWEKELNLTPHRSTGGQRFYQEEDFETFKKVKELLYERKFTLAGAKKELDSLKKTKQTTVVATQKTNMNSSNKENHLSENFKATLLDLKKKLQKLQKSL